MAGRNIMWKPPAACICTEAYHLVAAIGADDEKQCGYCCGAGTVDEDSVAATNFTQGDVPTQAYAADKTTVVTETAATVQAVIPLQATVLILVIIFSHAASKRRVQDQEQGHRF